MRKVAVFDLDGTIVYNTTAERELFYFLVQRDIVTPLQIGMFLLESTRLVFSGGINSLRRNKYYLYRIPEKRIRAVMPEFCSQRLQKCFSVPVIKHFYTLKEEGYEIVLLSGTPTLILEYLQGVLPFDFYIGCVLETKNERFTGRIVDIYPYGEDKVKAFKRCFADEEIDYPGSWCFANKFSDVPLMKLFGNPVAVHPDARLFRYARQYHWNIIP